MAYKLILVVCCCITIVVMSFIVWRAAVNRKEARVLTQKQLAMQLHEVGYEYAHQFNRLTLVEQRHLLQNLLDSEQELLVYRGTQSPGQTTEREHIFAPILAFLHDDIAFVAVWMSRGWKMTLPSRIQGPRNSVLRVLRNTERGPGVIRYFDAPWAFLKIADANWDGRYRMFCLPQRFDDSLKKFGNQRPTWLGEPVEFFHVAAFNFEGGFHMSGLELTLVGSGLLVRRDSEKLPKEKQQNSTAQLVTGENGDRQHE